MENVDIYRYSLYGIDHFLTSKRLEIEPQSMIHDLLFITKAFSLNSGLVEDSHT